MNPTVSASCLEKVHRMAARYAATPEEAEDLAQDVLLAALEQRRPLDGAGFVGWAAGVLRRHSLFVARTAGRRRRREAAYAAEPAPSAEPRRRLPREFVDTLPPSLRAVALLANVGLGRAEIASLLGIADTALRQRISALRRAWRRSGASPETGAIPRGYPSPDGPRRRQLRDGLGKLPGGRLATTDPDGHAIFVSVAHGSILRGNHPVEQDRRRTP